MIQKAPWTEVGALQQELSDIKRQLHGKADSYEVHSIRSHLDSLEHSVREISALVDGLRHWQDATESKLMAIAQAQMDAERAVGEVNE